MTIFLYKSSLYLRNLFSFLHHIADYVIEELTAEKTFSFVAKEYSYSANWILFPLLLFQFFSSFLS